MNETIINAVGKTYLSEVMEDLPNNVMLNKVTTGCGMTSVALSNSVKYVVAMPYVTLIMNKEKWCEEQGVNVLAVYGGKVSNSDIINFEGDKIMVTYDSLPLVTSALESRGEISEWKILIDECHLIIKSASYRYNAVKGLLKNYSKYGSFVFGSATPTAQEDQIPQLKDIPRVRIDWGELEEIKVNYTVCNKDFASIVATVALKHLNGESEGNAHIFINSVKVISKVVRLLNTTSNLKGKLRIVCADNQKNEDAVGRLGFSISEVSGEVRKINFYTSTAFEGSDIYDEDGVNYLITDGSIDHSKIDIRDTLPQIIGRVRNSKNKGTINLIYTANAHYSNTSKEEHRKAVEKNIEDNKQGIIEYNYCKNMFGAKAFSTTAIIGSSENNVYLDINDEGDLVLNELVWYAEMSSYTTRHNTYYVSKYNENDRGIKDGVICNNGTNQNWLILDAPEIKGINKALLGKSANFKDLCLDFIECLGNETPAEIAAAIDKFEGVSPLIVKAYRELGAVKMKALSYRKSEFNKALIICSKLSNKAKVVSLLNYRVGQFVSVAEAKRLMQKAFDKLGMDKKAKGTDLKEIYDYRVAQKRIDGKKTKGFIITTCKIKVVR